MPRNALAATDLAGLLHGLPPADRERLGTRLQEEFDGEADDMLGAAWLMGATTVVNVLAGRRTCRICGCWDYGACDPPCSWVAEDLCSACAPPPAEDDGPCLTSARNGSGSSATSLAEPTS